jgi:hypothetical protein
MCQCVGHSDSVQSMSSSLSIGFSVPGRPGTFRPAAFEALGRSGESTLVAEMAKGSAAGVEAKVDFVGSLQEPDSGLGFLAQQQAGPSNDDVFAESDFDRIGAGALEEFSWDGAAANVGSDLLQKVFEMIDADSNGSISQRGSSNSLDEVSSAASAPGFHLAPAEFDPFASSSSERLAASSAYSASSKSADLITMLQSLLKTAA